MIKIFIKSLVWILIIVSCESRQITTSNISSTKQISDTDFLFGQIKEVKPEKDGYYLLILDKKGNYYHAIYSIPNINNGEFLELNINDQVALGGEFWTLKSENRFTIRHVISKNVMDFTLRGKVIESSSEIEGNVYKVIDKYGITYQVLISLSNLDENHHTFKSFSIGDSIHTQGELWYFKNQLCVTVRKINI